MKQCITWAVLSAFGIIVVVKLYNSIIHGALNRLHNILSPSIYNPYKISPLDLETDPPPRSCCLLVEFKYKNQKESKTNRLNYIITRGS